MFLLIWFIWGVSQTSYYSAGEERANFLKIFWNVRMSAKSQGICWGLTAVLTVFSDMICFRGISLLETQGIVPESGSSLGQEELALLSPLSRLNKFAQMYKGSSVWQKKKCRRCSCLHWFKTEKWMQKKCQSQKQVVKICHVFKRHKSKQIRSLKTDLV